jgi:AAA ATPase domain
MNPFAPGMARRPLVIAGREDIIASFFGGLEQAKAGLGGPFTVFVGLRGMGKTTLLAELADRSEVRGWVTERFEANPLVEFGFASQLLMAAPQMVDRLHSLVKHAQARARRILDELQVGLNLGVVAATTRPRTKPETLPGDAPLRVERAIIELGEAARLAHQGVIVFLDELHEAPEHDLRLLGKVIQQVNTRRLPVVFCAAGLPVARRKATSIITFTERADWFALDHLPPSATAAALVGPAATQGVTFDPEALARLCDITMGYPYLIQVAGACVWDVKAEAIEITPAHIALAEPQIARALDAGVYRARWERATPGERDYLVALARLSVSGGPSVAAGEVAASMGKTAKAVSRVRAELIDKGTITTDGRRVLFSMPFFDRYVLAIASQDPDRRASASAPWVLPSADLPGEQLD